MPRPNHEGVQEMKTKHTPGPWELDGPTAICKTGKDWACIAQMSEPRPTGGSAVKHQPVSLGSERFHEACANAALMVLAPEMLEALKGMESIVTAFSYSNTLGKTQMKRLEVARKLISKAEDK